MANKFIYLRNYESVSEIQFIRLGHKGINKPTDGGNIRLDSYFDAKPADLAENIKTISITSQYAIFGQRSSIFAHFNVTSPFEIATPHLFFDKDQMSELIAIHHQNCINHTKGRIIKFPNGETVQLPDQCVLNSEQLAAVFEDTIKSKRIHREE